MGHGQLERETVSVAPGENNVQNSLLLFPSAKNTFGWSQTSMNQSKAEPRFTV